MDVYSMIGINIERIMISKGISIEELAQGLNVSKDNIKGILKGKKALNSSDIETIANFLGVSDLELVKVENETSSLHCSFLNSLKSRDEEGVKILMNAVNEIIQMEEMLED